MSLIKSTGLLAVSALMSFAACAEKKGGQELQARFASLQGQVTVNGQPADRDGILKAGDRIETGSGGQADLVIQQRGGLTLRENTSLTLDFKAEKLDLKLDRGDLLAAFHKLPANRDVSVVTPTAIAGVRGTHFFVKVHHDDHTYVCTCNGLVHYRGHGHEEGEVTEANHHKAYEFKRVDGKVLREDGEMKHHQDDHVERTADLIGKKIDWERVH